MVRLNRLFQFARDGDPLQARAQDNKSPASPRVGLVGRLLLGIHDLFNCRVHLVSYVAMLRVLIQLTPSGNNGLDRRRITTVTEQSLTMKNVHYLAKLETQIHDETPTESW